MWSPLPELVPAEGRGAAPPGTAPALSGGAYSQEVAPSPRRATPPSLPRVHPCSPQGKARGQVRAVKEAGKIPSNVRINSLAKGRRVDLEGNLSSREKCQWALPKTTSFTSSFLRSSPVNALLRCLAKRLVRHLQFL